MTQSQLFFGQILATSTNRGYGLGSPPITGGTGSSSLPFAGGRHADAGSIKTFRVILSAAPASGKTFTIAIWINEVASSFTLTFTNVSGVDQTFTGSLSIAQGDNVRIDVSSSGTPSQVTAFICTEYVPTTANYFQYPGGHTNAVSGNSATNARHALLSTDVDNWTFASDTLQNRSLCPIAGNIRSFWVSRSGGTSSAWTFIIEINGTEQASTSVSITGTGDNNVVGLSVAVSAGDQLAFKIKTASGLASARINWGVTIEPSNPGEFFICGGTINNLSNSATRYAWPSGGPATLSVTATESDVAQKTDPALIMLRAYGATSAAPGTGGSGKKYTETWRKNASTDTAITYDISETATTGSDTAHTVSLASGDTFDLKIVPTNTPTAVFAAWALALVQPLTATPGVAALTITRYAPDVITSIGTAHLVITTYVPNAPVISFNPNEVWVETWEEQDP